MRRMYMFYSVNSIWTAQMATMTFISNYQERLNHQNKGDGWNFWKPVTFIPTIPLRICLSPSIHPSYSDVPLIWQLRVLREYCPL